MDSNIVFVWTEHCASGVSAPEAEGVATGEHLVSDDVGELKLGAKSRHATKPGENTSDESLLDVSAVSGDMSAISLYKSLHTADSTSI